MLNRLTLFALLPFAFAAPVAAQEEPPTERINQVIVYGDDPCPQADDDTIVVCARMAEDERYRIPPQLRANPNDPRRESWTARAESLERVGQFGIDSCSPVGLGGFTGCMRDMIAGYRAERTANSREEWTNAVEEARRNRVEGFDAAADAEEADVVASENAGAAAARGAAARAAAASAAADAADAEIRRRDDASSTDSDGDTPLPDPPPPPPPPPPTRRGNPGRYCGCGTRRAAIHAATWASSTSSGTAPCSSTAL